MKVDRKSTFNQRLYKYMYMWFMYYNKKYFNWFKNLNQQLLEKYFK